MASRPRGYGLTAELERKVWIYTQIFLCLPCHLFHLADNEITVLKSGESI